VGVSVAEHFSPATAAWFNAEFDEPTAAQVSGWESIVAKNHTLIHAPTGSGKTLAAFLWVIDRLLHAPPRPPRERCRVLYVSPLKALAYDVDRNLRTPLTGIGVETQKLGLTAQTLSVGMRTGDTPQSERQAMIRNPPDMLITTPESLYLMLTSRAREILASVDTVIIDEIHAVAGTKRGSHLSLSLERLTDLTDDPPQRIGLSATQKPLDVLARFLGGGTISNDVWTPRPVTIVNTPTSEVLNIEIVVPVSDMTRPEQDAPYADTDSPEEQPKRSIWPAVYPRLLELLESHSSTILFVNSRGLAERLAAELNRLADAEIVQAHHGSVSREKRLFIEDRLKRGELKGVVATGTLELGIDMEAVDLVVLVESPSSVASGLQRVGRAGHQVGAPSVAKVFPKHRGDLLEAAVVVDRMYAGDIEPTTIPQNPIDVLSQQIVAMAAAEDLVVDEIFNRVRAAYPFRSLTRKTFESVLDMLSGRYPSDDFAELRPRIVWNRTQGTITARPNAKLLAVTNPGTIPDRGLYTVHLPDGGRVGELDEEMVYESRPGDTFVLGSTSWRIAEINRDRVIVTPSPGAPASKVPFWHGDAPGRPLELGRAIGAFVREVGALSTEEATVRLIGDYRLDPWAAQNLASYLAEERTATGHLPNDRTIVVQRFKDEIGDWRVVLLSPFGARVHAPWALALRNRFRNESGSPMDVIWSDDGILLRFPDAASPPDTALVHLDPGELEELVISEVGESALFSAKFREAAARALLLPRRRPGSRTPLWLQRRKAANLLEVTRDYGSFPIMLETYRDVMQDHFDLPALNALLTDIHKRLIRVVEVDTDSPSPFVSSLMFDFIASFMYEYDAPVAERRATALTLDRTLLVDLLGEPAFRELLDADAIASVEADLQHLSGERMVRSLDGMSDLLKDVGPLSLEEATARTHEPTNASMWLEELTRSERAALLDVSGVERYVAVEDLARLRDSIGVQPPKGTASDLLEPVTDPLGDIVGRYSRTHGPFTVADAAERTGLNVSTVAEVLARLERSGKVAAGAYRPGGTEHEWVSPDVLRRLRRRSLANLARQVEATDHIAYARFLPSWQGLGAKGTPSITDVVNQLSGASIPASVLESDVLAARLGDPQRHIDAALATGDVVWVGREPLGARDGKVSLYLRDSFPLLSPALADGLPHGPIHTRLIDYLENRGASFFQDLYHGIGGGDPNDVVDALWDLVWYGAVTSDSIAALRAFTAKGRRRTSSRKALPSLTPPTAAGRWYLTHSLVATHPSVEERILATINTLLDRFGIITKDVVLAEGVPGGFAGMYPALTSLEDVGSVRRGYFVEGLGGAQFGLPGAIDRLRSPVDADLAVMSATDPANAFGAVIPWPQTDGRPTRTAGARVAIDNGVLVAWMDASGNRVCLFTENLPAASAAVEALALAHGRASLSHIGTDRVHDHELAAELLNRGFAKGYKGFTLPTRGTTSRRRP
jgi:ATP-dependent Lhr-like helicase